jgi:hypothetical protein
MNTSADVPRDLDRLLDAWFDEVPTIAADRVVAAALRHVDQTQQVRVPWFGRVVAGLGAGGVSRRVVAIAVATLLVLALSLGLGIAAGLFRNIQPAPPAPEQSAEPISSPVPTPSLAAERIFTSPDGQFLVHLPAMWNMHHGDDRTALYLERSVRDGPAPTIVSIRIGDRDGRVRTCDLSVVTWNEATPEDCRAAVATSIEELIDAIGLPGAEVNIKETVLDGERAVTIGWRSYEYPARGSQSVVYVLAMHHERPVVVRLWSGNESGLLGSDEVIAGFRFVE